jgi:hypothetical protein
MASCAVFSRLAANPVLQECLNLGGQSIFAVPTAVAVDGQGNIYVAGNSDAQGFPITPQSPYTPSSHFLSSLTLAPISGAFILKLSDSGPSTPIVFSDGITSIAGDDFGPVTPGQIVDLIGSNLGPLNSAVLTLDANGLVAHTLAGVEVDFDGVAAPLVFVTSDDARAVVPFSVAGKSSVQVVVKTPAGVSPPVTVPVVAAAPALFTLGQAGPAEWSVLLSTGGTGKLQEERGLTFPARYRNFGACRTR